MKKRLVLALLVVAMVCALFTVTSFAAAEDHSHTSHEGWTAFTATGGALEAGKYYLTGDVAASSQFIVAGEVTICLAGNTISRSTSGRVFRIDAGATFTLCDCTETTNQGYIDATSHLWVPLADGETVPDGSTACDLTGGVVYGGVASDAGGNFYIGGTGCVANFYNVNIAGGHSKGTSGTHGGGGIYAASSATLNFVDSRIVGNYSASYGAGVVCSGDMTLDGCTVDNNYAATHSGGVCASGSKTTKLVDTIIEKNTAAGTYAGGIYTNNTTTMSGTSVIRNNTAKTYGGGLLVWNGTFNMQGGTISGNVANGTNSAYSTDTTTTAGTTYYYLGGGGGGVYVRFRGTFNMTGGTITDNSALYAGGGVFVAGTFNMEGTTTGTVITANKLTKRAWNWGGQGVAVAKVNGVFNMKGGAITDNAATVNDYEKGLGVFTGGTFNLSGGEISGHIGRGTNKVGCGAVCVFDGVTTMSGGEIKGNQIGTGAGVYIYGEVAGASTTPGGTFNMTGGTITGNTATHTTATSATGGAIRLLGTNAKANLSGGTISNNTCSGYGGAIYSDGDLTISGTASITENTGKDAGGVYVLSGTTTMSGGSITKNNGGFGAGVEIVSKGTFEMSGGTISDNVGSSASAIGSWNGTAVITGGTISGVVSSSGDTSATTGSIDMSGDVLVNGTVYGTSTKPMTVSGGTYKQADGTTVFDVTAYLADGYAQDATTGRVYGMAFQVGTTKYETLAEALENLGTATTVTMILDAVVGTDTTIPAAATLDVADKTLTLTAKLTVLGKLDADSGVVEGEITLGSTDAVVTSADDTLEVVSGLVTHDAAFSEGAYQLTKKSFTIQVLDGTTIVSIHTSISEAAAAAAGTDKVIQLVADYTDDASTGYIVSIAKHINLDLNGYTISVPNGSGINVTGDTGVTKIFSSAATKGTIKTAKLGVYLDRGGMHLENIIVHSPGTQAVSFMDRTGNYNTENKIKDCVIYNANWHTFSFNNSSGMEMTQMTFENVDIISNATNGSPIGGQSGSAAPMVTLKGDVRLYSKGTSGIFGKAVLTDDSKNIVKSNFTHSYTVAGTEVTGLSMWSVPTEVATAAELTAALANAKVDTIKLTAAITDAAAELTVATKTLDLNGNVLTVNAVEATAGHVVDNTNLNGKLVVGTTDVEGTATANVAFYNLNKQFAIGDASGFWFTDYTGASKAEQETTDQSAFAFNFYLRNPNAEDYLTKNPTSAKLGVTATYNGINKGFTCPVTIDGYGNVIEYLLKNPAHGLKLRIKGMEGIYDVRINAWLSVNGIGKTFPAKTLNPAPAAE